ncbi:hydrophobin-2 [Trichoderma citrinoviride]|uniref:Hydrophobin-2 n=1 Tax=Trichoderma citrinoviride TaxID=58853 RepID=A0A2T4BMG7_9HYPO|nr:hydrophobin-2 [Trichoderma citrinoviride]PTB70503.1 hydrophobin-2 [Trichoderma citrinoviride]
MQFFAVALFATSALAAVCPEGVFSNPLCCSSVLLEAVGLDCSTPTAPVDTGILFQAHCATKGAEPACCAVPVAGQAVLCQKPVGTL